MLPVMPVMVSLLMANKCGSPNTAVALEIQSCVMPLCHLRNYSCLETGLHPLISKAKEQKEKENIAKSK